MLRAFASSRPNWFHTGVLNRLTVRRAAASIVGPKKACSDHCIRAASGFARKLIAVVEVDGGECTERCISRVAMNRQREG